jgi:replicative DNA helicase
LLYSSAPLVVTIADYLDPDADLDEPARRAYCAVSDLASQGISPAPQLVLDELRRTGRLNRACACWLASAATAGVPPETARRYAALVVSETVRRQIDSWGTALVSSAGTAGEDELQVTIEQFSHIVSATFARLAALRGGTDD